ncbi:MAG: Hsp20/alpha crystallin family protein [Oscillochloridaceae bacterium umkhey_bin13]
MSTMIRWEPLTEAMSLREAMNRLFEESMVPSVNSRTAPLSVALDLSETAEAYLVELTVPGLKAEDLNITFENGVLSISGEFRQSAESEERNYHRVERRYGRFSRSINLPTSVRGDAISAALEHGILSLHIPKAEEVKPRKITINV